MIYRYLSKFLTLFSGILYYFSEILTEAAVGRKICKCLYWNLWKKWWKMSLTSFSSDESTTLLKMESTTDILIDQVHKFQNSDFKEHLWKAATVLQKAYCLRAYRKICSWYHPSKTTSTEAHRNAECIDLRFQFPKFRLGVMHFLFTTQAYIWDATWRKLLENRKMNIRKTL